MKTCRLVVLGGIASYRALFSWASPALFIGTLLVGPLTQLLFFVYLGRATGAQSEAFYIVGNSVLACSVACLFGGTMAVANESRYGTMSSVLLSSRSIAALFLGRAIPYVLNGLLASACTLIAGSFILGASVPWHALPGMLGLMVASSASCTMFGLVLGSLGLRFRDVWTLPNVFMLLLLILSQTEIPAAMEPAWLRTAGQFVPITHAAEAARRLASGSGDVWPGAVGEIAIAVGYGILAVLLLRFFEAQARRSATLDLL